MSIKEFEIDKKTITTSGGSLVCSLSNNVIKKLFPKQKTKNNDIKTLRKIARERGQIRFKLKTSNEEIAIELELNGE